MSVVGFIGLGTMGLPMAKNLFSFDKALMVADLMQKPKDEMQALGADVRSSNIEIAKACDIIFLSLPTVGAVKTVCAEVMDHASPGTWIIDTSTNSHQLCADLWRQAEEKSMHYVDAPVSGGAGKAAAGTLSILVGASETEMEKAGIKDMFEVIGKSIHYADVRGGGVALKIINNMLSKGIMYTVGEAVVMAEKLDIPFDKLYDVVQTSSSANEIFRIKKEHIQDHDYAPSSKSYAALGTITIKDMLLAREIADETGVSAFVCNAMIQIYRMAMAEGFGEMDASFIVEMLRKANGI